MAELLARKGDYAGAEPLFRRVLESHRRVSGPEHPDTLVYLNNLAVLLKMKGDYANAEALFRRALEALLKTSAATGRPHPNLQSILGNYAGCLEKQGRSREAIRNNLEAMMRPSGFSLDDGGQVRP